jgi:demethylmenaquinone methyltransferase/2-methoxy-6-polyprenyl-1,4-benzoquinol methylase
MFATIAKRYDLANHLLSFGFDFSWRRFLTKRVQTCYPKIVVDLATGSGDVAFSIKKALGPNVCVKGLDFCQPMLDQANLKQRTYSEARRVEFIHGDCLNLPFEDNSIDVLTLAFGLRNLEDRARGFEEMRRVLRKDHGSLFILEFTQPNKCIRPLYYFYLKNILPFFAQLTTGNKEAYHYLAGSIEAFPSRGKLCEEILHAGFRSVHATGLTGSIVAVHEAAV